MPVNLLDFLPAVGTWERLLLAALLGGLVGWQRERRDHPAGLRTHILVCLGAALLALVDSRLPGTGGRIAAQVVTGVGFLGAGTILRSGEGSSVRGLTTAASVWAIAGVGIAVGYGGAAAQAAVVATALILFTLVILALFENRLLRRRERQKLSLVLAENRDPLGCVERLLRALKSRDIKVHNFEMQRMSRTEVIRLSLRFPPHTTRDAVDALLTGDAAIIHHDWGE